MNTPYYPQPIFGKPSAGVVPRVFAAPPKYVQGPGVLDLSGHYLDTLGFERMGILASKRSHGAEAGRVAASLSESGIQSVPVTFGGECSLEEIESATEQLRQADVECLIAVGGGKCVDAGKCVSGRLEVPVVIVPTLASNDAPTSAVAVVYTPEGVNAGAEFLPNNPVMVIVDTDVVAKASERYLVAGIGDAMATWYEARVCFENPQASNVVGSRPTLAATAIAEICARTLYEDGEAAAKAVREGEVNDALERVVEANTLLSGLGFESGGLAAAHGVAGGLTIFPAVEEDNLHGELVAIGTGLQVALDGDEAEAEKVTEFFARVGLPVHLEQVGIDVTDSDEMDRLVDEVLQFGPLKNIPRDIDGQTVRDGLLAADRRGRAVTERLGDGPFRALRDS